ncbi:MAG: sugar ABC transporter substrate-binding protein, partial [Roseburia sp.]|nr:sugar ABC transporter substrate-binding protein [Roseburia sp.]
MKKKLLSALLCVSMAATLVAGCGSNETQEDNSGNNESKVVDTQKETDSASGDAAADPIANLIAATEGTVEIDLWCSELPAYQEAMATLVEEFKAQYPDVDFNITIGACSEADTKDRVLEDVEAAADVYVFADDQIQELVNAGALQAVSNTFTYD